jgi:hypothetical protein
MNRILCKWRLDSLGFCARETFFRSDFVQSEGGVAYHGQELGVL